MRTRVKICCIETEGMARLAIAAGASALGLVTAMPSGPGVISDALARRIAGLAPPGVATFLLTCETDPARLVAQVAAAGTNVVQIVDAVAQAAYAALRQALPAVKIVQVIHVEDEDAVAEARGLAPLVDGLLLDSGRPKAAIKELGGTGRVHDWAISRRIVGAVACPVYLAGGLGPGNVADAIRTVRPFGVDLCSGVRTDGMLDEQKLGALMRAVHAAAQS
jgi:phosphoribosylanthranilate isomerase